MRRSPVPASTVKTRSVDCKATKRLIQVRLWSCKSPSVFQQQRCFLFCMLLIVLAPSRLAEGPPRGGIHAAKQTNTGVAAIY